MFSTAYRNQKKKKKKSRCNTIKCLCDPKQIKILTHSHLPLDILKGYINVYMIQLDFFLLYFIQLHILVHKNTIYKPHMWSCWNLRFSSLEYLSDESNKKSKYSYAALKWCKWCKWYNCLEELNQACAACCIWIETVFQLMLKSSSNGTLFFFFFSIAFLQTYDWMKRNL